jgi:Fe-S-cluster containining protein
MRLKITAADCRSCGACCTTDEGGGDVLAYGYADLSTEDVARLSPRVRAQLHDLSVGGERRYATRAKQLPAGACVCQHLRGTPGQRCSCTIYETRPEICREFRVGGLRCREARAALELSRQEGHV